MSFLKQSYSAIKKIHYKQDSSFLKYHQSYNGKGLYHGSVQKIEQKLLQYIMHTQKKNLKKTIDDIDSFCSKHWMMHIGPQKAQILKHVFDKNSPKKILQLGGYCGYSSLLFSYLTQAKIFTVQINQSFAGIASQIHNHAGVKERNQIFIGVASSLKKQISENGPYDVILIDHEKNQYLPDFKLLEEYGVIKAGTLVIADNIIIANPKGYLDYFKQRQDYSNTLYHSFVEYCDIPDAVLVSEKI